MTHTCQGQAAEWRADRTCSYCGSAHPADFLAACEAGQTLTPTDKNYKVYVRGAGGPAGKFYFSHLDQAAQDRFIALHNEGKLKLAHPGRFYVTPYFCEIRQPGAAANVEPT